MEKKYYIIDFSYFDYSVMDPNWESILLKAEALPSRTNNDVLFLNYVETITEPKNITVGPRWILYKNSNEKNFKIPLRFKKDFLEKCELKGVTDDETARLIFECS